jgi:pilus assembly protein CpaD
MRDKLMNARLPVLLAGLAALPACATAQHAPTNLASPAEHHQIVVSPATERMELPVSAEVSALEPGEADRLVEFAKSYMRAGHGAMVMSTPSGAANSDNASLKAHEARLALVEAGVPFSQLAGSTYDAAGSDSPPIIVTYERFVAEAPQCAPLWTQDLAHQSDNQPWESFGCANEANLAAMLEDPHDLLGPRDEDPRDSARRGVVFSAYRAGNQTHAERDKDERVSISDAVH